MLVLSALLVVRFYANCDDCYIALMSNRRYGLNICILPNWSICGSIITYFFQVLVNKQSSLL